MVDDSQSTESNGESPPDSSTKAFELGSPRHSAARKLAIRRASMMASMSMDLKVRPFERQMKVDRRVIQTCVDKKSLDVVVLDAEMDFISKIEEMDPPDQAVTLFELFDRDGNLQMSVNELFQGFNTLRNLPAFYEKWDEADEVIQQFLKRHDGLLLSHQTFQAMISALANILECSFTELVQVLALDCLGRETGASLLDEAVYEMVGDDQFAKDAASQHHIRDAAIREARIILLFQVLDADSRGKVPFFKLINSLPNVSPPDGNPYGVDYMSDDGEELVDEESTLPCALKRQLLAALESGNLIKMLDYPQFAEFILAVVTSYPEDYMDFHDVVNSITLSLVVKIVTEDDVQDLVERDDYLPLNHYSGALLPYGRLERLFSLLDLDHDGFIDHEEFVKGFGKFYNGKGEVAIRRLSRKTMKRFDRNDDSKLSREEFAIMMTAFADKSDFNIHQLIDYFVVQAALNGATKDMTLDGEGSFRRKAGAPSEAQLMPFSTITEAAKKIAQAGEKWRLSVASKTTPEKTETKFDASKLLHAFSR